jgi:hypothetical protein
MAEIDNEDLTEGTEDQGAGLGGPASTTAVAGGAAVSTDGGAALGPMTPPAESGRRADSLFTPDVTGGSEGFASTPGGTLLAPDVAPEEADPTAGS